MNAIKQCWAESKTYRILLAAAGLYFLLRLVLQLSLFAYAFTPEGMAEGTLVSADLQNSYIPAAEHFRDREDLYLQGSLDVLELHFPYSPVFAFLYGPILLLPLGVLVTVMVTIHLVCYWLLYVWWDRIFRHNNLREAELLWAKSLPLFLSFTVFWDDLGILNIYLIVALFATFAIDAALQEKLGWASFWIGAIILPMKPHWAFALGIPLLLGRYRFFFKLAGESILAYLAVVGLTILGGGADYVLRQYQEYAVFLGRLSRDFPWREHGETFFGYNHSVMQTVLYYLGATTANMQLATVIKLLLLAPLGFVILKFLRNPINKSGRDAPETALTLGFALYLGAFIWLDMVWEISLALVIFVFLHTILKEKWQHSLLWIVFAPYAFLEIWRFINFIIFGYDILIDGAYVRTDPFIYIPWILVILLVFYGLIVQRLWKTTLDSA